MEHDDNIAALAEGIWVRSRRDRATANREFVVLSVRGEERAARSEERTQPLRIVHLADDP